MPRQLPIDMLNESSKEIVYIRKNRPLLKKLAKETHFNLKEVEALALIHYKICKEHGSISRTLFRDIFHSGLDYTENIRHLLVDKVFSAMIQQNALHINMEQWVRGFSVILRGTLEERINFAFKVYDLMMTGRIKREQIFNNMRGCFISLGSDENVDETLKDFVDLILKTLDVDRDGSISEGDFKSAVMDKDKLLLECMGPVFPSRDYQYAFSTTFTNNIGDF
ncbi:EF-hand calcium-binding domain-containing protein 1-like [Chelonus insularis]|uniref:EF-hand calcium-binding domain-containing protein 1-like n=1 Tax=Chelonus insularis TaxID=460826 RepID=UPI0015893463|nr:EF-hand calcium-binding domain-containing protein 1-like [Chelonus insularis]